MIEHIEHRGLFISEINADGERRSAGVAPAHPNGLQLARDRFLILVSTLGFRGVDDARSICYQLRADDYDGPVIREGVLARSIDDWQPLSDGNNYVRQFGHPLAFGVPKGARLNGVLAPHHNSFVLKYRQCARVLHPDGYLLWNSHPPEVTPKTQGIEWLQFRLNDANDDIEITRSAQPLRQKGFEDAPHFCADARLGFINQSYVQPVPFNADKTEWVDVCHFNHGDMHHTGGSLLATMRYVWNRQTRFYEWTQAGAPIEAGLFEGNISPWHEEWILSGRPVGGGKIGWARVRDPFAPMPPMVFPDEPHINAPLTTYACADGVLRFLSGDPQASPYQRNRLPLYIWDVLPEENFRSVNRRVVFDALAANVPIALESGPQVDFAKVLPHAGGEAQWVLHRVRSNGLFNNDPAYGLRKISSAEFQATGIYAAKIHYRQAAASWDFGDAEVCDRRNHVG